MFGALERQPFVLVSRSSLGLTASSRAGSLPQIPVCGQKVEVPETTKPSYFYEGFVLYGAGTRSRTRDLLITSQLLYQLSYTGVLGDDYSDWVGSVNP